MEGTPACSRVPFRNVANNAATRDRSRTKTKQNVVGCTVAKGWAENPPKENKVPSCSLSSVHTPGPLVMQNKKTSFMKKCPSKVPEDRRIAPPEKEDSFDSFFLSMPDRSYPAGSSLKSIHPTHIIRPRPRQSSLASYFYTPNPTMHKEPQDKNNLTIPGSNKKIPEFLPCDKRYSLCADAILEAIEGNKERLSPQRTAEKEDDFVLIHPRNVTR